MTFMTPADIAATGPDKRPDGCPTAHARRQMAHTGQWGPAQAMGRRWPIGCVALEVTQRCNLDCTLCYLSDGAESVRDIPLSELFRRIDAIRLHYGPNTDVQVTGGDPTLRDRSELVAIVRRIRERDMRPALFTNGIRATRDLLQALSAAGLVDVAFHVDTTQNRRFMATEAELNAVRAEYIARARGLKLSVMFNTTVHGGNFAELPGLARFFVANSDVVRLASFQLQADTGRGVVRGRADAITPDSVAARIMEGAGTSLAFDTVAAGHASCNRYAMALVANGRATDLFDDKAFIRRMLAETAGLQFDRTDRRRAIGPLAAWLLRHPGALARGVPWAARKAWAMRRDLVAGRGRVGKLSFFIHNFMGADGLDRERVDACVFKVATADGPVSMCLHNARRDDFVLQTLQVDGRAWDPLGAGPAPQKGRTRVRARS